MGSRVPVLMPQAIVSYHWPRADLDQLLCLKVEDISSCQWSGGFPLNKDQSFHIHMRCVCRLLSLSLSLSLSLNLQPSKA